MSRFRFIAAEQAVYPIALLCRFLQVSRAGYDAWAHRGQSARARADAHLTEHIRQVHARSRATYWAPRVHADLGADGIRVGRKRVERLLRAAGISACPRASAGAPRCGCPGCASRRTWWSVTFARIGRI